MRRKQDRIKEINAWKSGKDQPFIFDTWCIVEGHFKANGIETALKKLEHRKAEYIKGERQKYGDFESEETSPRISMPAAMAMREQLEYLYGLEQDKIRLRQVIDQSKNIENVGERIEFLTEAKSGEIFNLISTDSADWRKMLQTEIEEIKRKLHGANNKENDKQETEGQTKANESFISSYSENVLKWNGTNASLYYLFRSLKMKYKNYKPLIENSNKEIAEFLKASFPENFKKTSFQTIKRELETSEKPKKHRQNIDKITTGVEEIERKDG